MDKDVDICAMTGRAGENSIEPSAGKVIATGKNVAGQKITIKSDFQVKINGRVRAEVNLRNSEYFINYKENITLDEKAKVAEAVYEFMIGKNIRPEANIR